jgi:beta-1,4-mannosyltransferase
MKVLFYPAPDDENDYSQNMLKNIRAVVNGTIKYSPNIKDIVLRPHKTFCYKKYDVAIINWLENNVRNERKGLSIFGVIKFFVYILYFKLAAKKTVYVRHNFYPHDMPVRQAKLAKKIVDFAEKLFDKKVTHSGHLVTSGYTYIPHPLYDVAEHKATSLLNDKSSYYLIFGRVERYKAIETIIDNWSEPHKLLIVGFASDDRYVSELVEKAKGRNIKFDIRFIPTEEVDSIMLNARAIILAHAGDEMIVSGSFFHAISYGLPVVASNQPFLSWLKGATDYSGLKLYDTKKDFRSLLDEANTTTKKDVLLAAEASFGDAVIQSRLNVMFNELKN